jgi:uncharacterized delta-60 repeat protein
VLVVAARVSQGRGRALDLMVGTNKNAQLTTTLRVDVPTLDLPPSFTVTPRIGTVIIDRDRRLVIAISWDAVDPNLGLRPVGIVDQARASVVRLNPVGAANWQLDAGFGDNGTWLATGADGVVTTADHVVIANRQQITLVGQAIRNPGQSSLFAAGLSYDFGAPQWTSYPAAGVLKRPAAVELDRQGRIVIAGATVALDHNAPSDPAEVVVACVRPSGDLESTYGNAGIARYRLHDGTHPTAIHVPSGGGIHVGGVVSWGWQASAVSYHPCVTKLDDSGTRDLTFGTAGLCRHDGVGESRVLVVDGNGRACSAGVAKVFDGMKPGFWPSDPHRPTWLNFLTATRLTAAGEFDSTFGGRGIATLQLGPYLPVDEQHFDVSSIVPLANGQSLVSGWYAALVPAPPPSSPGTFVLEDRGSWIVRFTPGGRLDTAFNGGVRVYPGRFFAPLTPLADETIQGFESTTGLDILRLTPDGSPVPGFGTNGRKPVTRMPSASAGTFLPDGEWFAPFSDQFVNNSETFGLLRYGPDGVHDQTFGGGTINIASTAKHNAQLSLDDLAFVHRLADGSLLMIWSMRFQVDVRVLFGSTVPWQTYGMLLASFNSDGSPRPVVNWNNQAVRCHPNPVGTTGVLADWLGWRVRSTLLQADGSFIVGLQGDDPSAKPSATQEPRQLRQVSYFCRLVQPDFDLDPAFGTGFVSSRLPGPADEDQVPLGLGPGGAGRVNAVLGFASRRSGLFDLRPPDLPLDGSIGMARLV